MNLERIKREEEEEDKKKTRLSKNQNRKLIIRYPGVRNFSYLAIDKSFYKKSVPIVGNKYKG